MTSLVPNRFLFDFSFALAYRSTLPKPDGSLKTWRDAERLPSFSEIDHHQDFAELWACWNEEGIAIACRVSQKRHRLRCDPKRYWEGDNLRLCLDLRDTRNIRRASRYCRQFCFLPTGGGRRRTDPVAGVGQFQRAREVAPAAPVGWIQVGSSVTATGYSLEGVIPRTCLSGFDPEEHPRIGFYYLVEDGDHGQQYLTVGDDLSWNVDPSTWATARLER